MPSRNGDAPSVGVWGLSDSGDAAAVASSAIVAAELRRRLPGASLAVFAPLGRLRPTPRDGGLDAQPLEPVTAAHLAEVAGELDLVVVAAVAGVGPAAYGAGGEAIVGAMTSFAASGHAGLAVVGGALALLPRHYGTALLDRRAALLRMLDWMPAEGRWLAVDAAVLAGPQGAALRDAAGRAALELVALDPSGLAELASGALGGPAPAARAETGIDLPGSRSLPSQAGVEDLCAAVRAAAGVVASAAGFLASAGEAFAVPTLALDGSGDLDAWVEQVGDGRAQPPDPAAAVAAADAELDAVAALAPPAARQAPDTPALTPASPEAPDPRRLRIVRRELLGEVGRLEAQLAERERLRAAEVGRWRGEAERWQGEYQGLLASKTWRYTEPARALYRRVRRRGSR